jgi:hypothetical protein
MEYLLLQNILDYLLSVLLSLFYSLSLWERVGVRALREG